MDFTTTSCSSDASVAPRDERKKKKKTKGGGCLKLSTDPQSVAARERRHRISDRFKTLRSLVPGGHKMDTVSMLDEAIHYTKYLKSQLWMHETILMCNSGFRSHGDAAHGLFYDPSGAFLPEVAGYGSVGAYQGNHGLPNNY